MIFIGTCVVYFLACRRLSLVFEWAFLMGFPGALPFCWAAARLRNRIGPLSALSEAVLTGLGFFGFFLASSLVLLFR